MKINSWAVIIDAQTIMGWGFKKSNYSIEFAIGVEIEPETGAV